MQSSKYIFPSNKSHFLHRCHDTNTIHVLTKGAESAVLPACAAGERDATERVVASFAADYGLRTLVLAHKEVGEEEYREFAARLEHARQSIVNR